MGFDVSERERFKRQMLRDLKALEELLGRPGFGCGPLSIGAELELFLIDGRGRPVGSGPAVLAAIGDPRVAPELGAFNLEINTFPTGLIGRPFAFLGRELGDQMAKIERTVAPCCRVAAIGILPTLRWEDFDRDALTDRPRYQALRDGLLRLRIPGFTLTIDGDEPLSMCHEDITIEAAGTSFHLHLRVDPDRFSQTFNAARLAVGPVLAAAGNSPTLLGHRLWEETRVPLLRQWSLARTRRDGHIPDPRVSFGYRWLRGGAAELFRRSVELYQPLLVEPGSERDALSVVRDGGVPTLDALRLHQGTVWGWNRPVYDPAEGGHLRVEMRSLPAGPSLRDMLANAAFQVGLVLALRDDMERLIEETPFEVVRQNFFAAARVGLDAEIRWPLASGLKPARLVDLLPEMVPLARRGLVAAGVDEHEAGDLLTVFAQRVESGRTGSWWQRQMLEKLERDRSRPEALAAMLERYLKLASSGEPVHLWPL